MNDEQLRTGELSIRAGVNKETLRFYERKGLLKKPARTPSGYRLYDEIDVDRVVFIKNAQKLGFSLREIKELLEVADGRIANRSDIRKIAEAKLEAIDRQIRGLQQLRTALAELVRKCATARGKCTCPIVNALSGNRKTQNECEST